MCESAAYILKEDGMERIMDNVVSVDPVSYTHLGYC